MVKQESWVKGSFLSQDMDDDEQNLAQTITYQQLLAWCFAPGKVYWKSPSGKNITILRGGEFLDHDYLKKYFKRQESLDCESHVSYQRVKYLNDSLEKLREAKLAPDQVEISQELTAWLSQSLWGESSELLSLELIESCHKNFFEFDEQTEEKILSTCEDLFTFISLQAALCVCLSFSLGYINYGLLKDLYRAHFLYHLSLFDQLSTKVKKDFWSDSFDNVLEKTFKQSKELTGNYRDQFSYTFSLAILDSLIKVQSAEIDGKRDWSHHDFSDLENVVAFSFHWAHDIYRGRESVNFSLKGELKKLFSKQEQMRQRLKLLLEERWAESESLKATGS